MKKYVKPELYYERYELSQHIADCVWEMNYNGDNDACTGSAADKGYGSDVLFNASNGLCTMHSDIIGEYCIMASTTSKVTFIS